MKTFSFPAILLLIAFHCFSQVAIAHGDLHERILEASKEIEITPDSAFLYFKRGKLYFQDESYKEAIQDLDQATLLGYSGNYCNLIFAKSYQKLSRFEEALQYVAKVESQDSFNVNALHTKAQILFEQKHFLEAALTFEKVIVRSIRTLPENYTDASKAWESLETESGDNRAIQILKKGVEQLGPLFIFYERMRALYIKREAYKEALEQQQVIIDLSTRKETAYYEAAEICLLSKNKEQAKRYLNLGLQAIEQVPLRIQNNKAMLDLKRDMEIAITKL